MPEDSLIKETTEVPLEEVGVPTYSATLNGKPAYVSVDGLDKYDASLNKDEGTLTPKAGNVSPKIEYGAKDSPEITYNGPIASDPDIERYIGSGDEEITGDLVPQDASEKYPSGKPEVGLDEELPELEGAYRALLLIKYDTEKDNLVVGGFFPADMGYSGMHGITSLIYGAVNDSLGGAKKNAAWEYFKPLEIQGQNYTLYALTDSQEALEGATEIPLLGAGEMPENLLK